MIDLEYSTENEAYSMSFPVYYKRNPERFMIFFDIDRKNTIITESHDLATLPKLLKENIRIYYQGRKK